jgi:hypothetical protein
MAAPFVGLAGALLSEEGWEVLSLLLEPPSWRGLGEPTDGHRPRGVDGFCRPHP